LGLFRARFIEKFFFDNAKFDWEVEFLTLQQGKMTMQAYAKLFVSSPILVSKYNQEVEVPQL